MKEETKMKKGYFTQQELINLKLMTQSFQLVSSRIKDLLDTHFKSEDRRLMKQGVDYYNGKHDILEYSNYYYLDGQKIKDETKSNNKLVHQFHKILVDQKASYLVGNPIVVSKREQESTEGEEAKDDEQEYVNDYLGEEFDDLVNDWVTSASNQSIGWVHFYIDGEGDLQYLVMDSSELIPIYDTKYEKELVGVIRYYEIEEIDEMHNYTNQKRKKVEWWTDQDVTYYAQLDNGDFALDPEYEVNPAGHFVKYNSLTPDKESQLGWGKVPFVSLLNNSQKKTDLEPTKSLIDAYDKVKSGWINDLQDFQELIYILKGYSALTSKAQKGLSDLAVFLQNLKTNKVISVEEGGGVETLKAEIPIEAKNKFLEITRKEIFYFGQGVDVDNDKFGNNPSGISLKFLYAQLDLKANTLMRKMKKSLSSFLWFITEYLSITESTEIDPEDFIFVFNKAVIFNEKEKVDMLVASEGMISEQTRLENHPLVDNVAEEQARLEVDEEKKVESGYNELELIRSKQVTDQANKDQEAVA